MRNRSKSIVMLLSLMILCLVFGISTNAETREGPEIIADRVVLSEGFYTAMISLKGEADTGDRIIVEYCDDDGSVKERNEYDFCSQLEVSYDDVKLSEYLKIFWSDAEQNQRCDPAVVCFNKIHTLDWMGLTEMLSVANREYTGKVEIMSSDPAYMSGRLIVKINGELPDLSSYRPVLIIIDDENHGYIQFLCDEDAINCAEYLATLDNVIYVEPDSYVYVSDDSEQEAVSISN